MSEALHMCDMLTCHEPYLELVIIERSSLPRTLALADRLVVRLAGPVPCTRRSVHKVSEQTRIQTCSVCVEIRKNKNNGNQIIIERCKVKFTAICK